MRLLFALAITMVVCGPAYAQRFVRSIDTIAALLADNAANIHTNVQVNGYYTPNDGGGGPFVFVRNDTSTVDNGIIFASTNPASPPGRWKRQFEDVLDSPMFGLRGDGSDEQAKLQSLLNAASNTTKRVWFDPDKTYMSGNTVVAGNVKVENANLQFNLDGDKLALQLRSNTELLNCNVSGTGINLAASGGGYHVPIHIGDLFGETGTTLLGYSNIVIRGGSVTGWRTNGTDILIASDSNNGLIENVRFPDSTTTGANIGFNAGTDGATPPGATRHPFNWTVRNITTGIRSRTGGADVQSVVYISGSHNINLDNIYCQAMYGSSVIFITPGDYGYVFAPADVKHQAMTGIRVSNVTCPEARQIGFYADGLADNASPQVYYSVPLVAENLRFTGNAASNAGHGIQLARGFDMTVRNSLVDRFQTGVTLDDNTQRAMLQGVRAWSNWHNGFSVNATIKPTDNTIDTCEAWENGQAVGSYSGIFSGASIRTTIRGNELGGTNAESAQLFGVRVSEETTHATIINNTVRRTKATGTAYALASDGPYYDAVWHFRNNSATNAANFRAGIRWVPVDRQVSRSGTINTDLTTAESTVPPDGTWFQGDMVRMELPTPLTNYTRIAWFCIEGGVPGSWFPIPLLYNVNDQLNEILVQKRFRASSEFALVPSAVQTLGPTSNLVVNSGVIRIVSSGGAVTFTNSIPDSNEGELLYIIGTSDTDTITFQTVAANTNSNVKLKETSVTLGASDVLPLVFDPTASLWLQYASVIEGAGGSGYITVEDDGVPLPQRNTINFTGAGVTASDSGGKTVVNIPGGSGGSVTNFSVGTMSPLFTVSDPTSFPTLAAVDPGGHRIYGWNDTSNIVEQWLYTGAVTTDPATHTLTFNDTSANWVASGTTNSSLSGVATLYGLIATNNITAQNDLRVMDVLRTDVIEYDVVGVSPSGGTLTFDFDGPRRQTNSNAGSLTVAFVNLPASITERPLILQFKPSGGTLTLTWPTTIGGQPATWIGPAVTSIASGTYKEVIAYWQGLQTFFADLDASGTVTSVGMTVPGGFSITGSPITTSGTLAIEASGEQPYYFLRGDFNGSSTWDNSLIYSNANNTTSAVYGAVKRGRTGDATTSPASGGILGQYRAGGWDGTQYLLGPGWAGYATENWTAGAIGAELRFFVVANGAAVTTDVFTLRQDGSAIPFVAAAPTTATAGAYAFDNNAWASGRGALQIYDGTANTYVLGALASDAPSNGQVPVWKTGGTIEWEDQSGGGSVNTNGLAGWQLSGSGADFSWTATDVYEKIIFGTSGPSFTLTNAGTYLLNITIGSSDGGTFAQKFYLTNITDSAHVAGYFHYYVSSPSGEVWPSMINRMVTTTGANRQFEIWGSTANSTPTAADVVATNTTVSVVYLGNPLGGTGDVIGPASSTDNALVRFDGTNGKGIQNSTWTLDDTGNLTIGDNTQANQTLTFNLSGTDSALTAGSASLSYNGQFADTFNSAASTAAGLWSGTWFTGGSATTTKPHILIEPTGTTSTAWSTSGTGLGINAASGFSGRLIDAQVNGSSVLNVTSSGSIASLGTLSFGSAATVVAASRSRLSSPADGTWLMENNAQTSFTLLQLGSTDATPNNARISAGVANGTDTAAGSLQLGSIGTGAAVPANVLVIPYIQGASSSTPQSAATGVGIGGTLKVDTTTTGNIGSGEDDLISYTIPAGQFNRDGAYIEFDVFGTFAATANSAQVKLYFDGTAFFDSTSLVFNGLTWRATGKIIRTSATTQKIICDFGVSGTLLGALTTTTRAYTTDNATLSGTTVFKVTGQDTGGVPASDKVVQEGMTLQWFPGQ